MERAKRSRSLVLAACGFCFLWALYSSNIGLSTPAQVLPKATPTTTTQQHGIEEVFASLWTTEYNSHLGLQPKGPLPNPSAKFDIVEVLNNLQDTIDIIFVSATWAQQQATQDGSFDFEVMKFIQDTVCGRGFKLAVLLDACNPPSWVADLFPDAMTRDAGNATGRTVSFDHPEAMQLVHAWHKAVLAELASNNASCIHSIQPSFSNEYETKYTQERDAAQDYGPATRDAFRGYIHSVHSGLDSWNLRWATTFKDWAAVVPPHFFQFGGHYNSTTVDLFYWDWQHYRHMRLHSAHEACCQRIAASGFRCIMHFPEFLTSGDAIYAAGAVFTLAASPWLDYIIVDSNFQTIAGHPNDVRVVRLLLSAMKPYGKPVFFEGAFEVINDPAVHRQAVQMTAASGAYGMGFTNWLNRVDHKTFFAEVFEGVTSPVGNAPSIAILTPYRSYSAFKGTPFVPNEKGRAPTDPQQDVLFECLDVLEAKFSSLDGLQIFGVPTMLLPVLHTFEHIFYVEPDVMLSGDANTVASIKARASLLGVPLQRCSASTRNKPATIVLPECCPSM